MYFTAILKAAALLLWSTSAVFAQSEAGSAAIQGVVTDPSGGRVAAGEVTLRHLDTGYVRTVETNADGQYAARVMPVGGYQLEAQAPGFARARLTGVMLRVGSTETVNVQLRLPAATEEVTVVERRDAVDVAQAGASAVIDQRAVLDLPVRGRNFAEFSQLSPGIIQEADRSGLVIAGQRSINSNVALDGADFNDPLQGNQRGGNQAVFSFPQSAVREFQVVRSGAGAEVGRTSAGFVNVVTRSGTNAFHGDLFYYNRNRSLTSANAFGRKLNNQQNQFGGSVGGPLVRDRAFFFAAAEQNYLRVPFVVEFQPQAPGVVVPAELRALEGEKRGTNNPTAVFSRVDWSLDDRHTLSTHYTYARMRGENFNFDSPRVTDAEATNYAFESGSHALKTSLVSVLSPAMVNELRFQVATDDRIERPNGSLPRIEISGFGTINGDHGRPRRFESTRYQVSDNLSGQAGSHQWRVGVDFNHNDLFQQRESNISGRYSFSSLQNYINGVINRYRQSMSATGEMPFFEGAQQELAFFVQDAVNLHPRLTLTAGLRWEGQWHPQPTDPHPDVPETARIPNDLGQWQPRLGLAWDLGGAGATVLRISSGIYTARTPGNLLQRVFTNNGTASFEVDSRLDPGIIPSLDYPHALASLPENVRVAAPRVFGFHPDFRNPRSFQASATLDHQAAPDLTVSIGYTRNATWALQRRLDRNLFPPTIDEFGMPVYPNARPNPDIGILSINESSAYSSYDGLTLSATRRMRNGFQVGGHYTLSRTYDDDSNERNFSQEPALNVFDLKSERAYSKQDVRHNANIHFIADLPGGVTFSSILITRSGFPYTPVVGFDVQRDGNEENDRAIIDGRVVGRNSFRQPSFFNLDLRVLKGFQVGEQSRFDFIAEVFNATRASNRNYGNDAISVCGTPDDPVATCGQPLFAPSTARFGGPRQLQLGLRLTF